MQRHDMFDDDEEDSFSDEEIDEQAARPPWWTGRTALVSALCVVGVVALGFTVFGATRDDATAQTYPALPSVVPPKAAEPAATATEPREIVVSVVGAVRQPGLARLVPGARVSDAIDAAGGLNAEAETSALNLAQKLEDGDQVVIGAAPTQMTTVAEPGALPASRPQRAPPRSAPPKTGSRCDCAGNRAPGGQQAGHRQTDVNAATEAELDAVPGIGKGIAKAIVQYRAAHGRIHNLDELAKIKQVGASRLKKLRPYLRV